MVRKGFRAGGGSIVLPSCRTSSTASWRATRRWFAACEERNATLVDNAIKYTPPGGQVELTTARSDASACLTVTDSGVGIALEDLPRIWERLYRADESRSERGLGLGLSFVKAIVEAHGGQAEVHSRPGAGATFIVRLPSKNVG